jgi:hypothetical protein
MNPIKSTNVSISDLNVVIGSVREAYNVLSTLYYLPAITSKAISKPYLQALFIEDSNILEVPRKITNHHISFQGNNVCDMLEKLEDFLKANNHPPTGLDVDHLPDYRWLYNVCLHYDPNNTMNIVRSYTPTQQTITRNINPL